MDAIGSPLNFNPKIFAFTPSLHQDTYDFIDPKHANLQGKNVLITGASRGIGKGLAISYAKAGASGIAIAARSSLSSVVDDVKAAAKQAGRAEPHVLALSVDVVSFSSVQDSRKQLDEAFKGQLDVVVANHGYLEEFIPITDSNPDEWWKSWEINIHGVYNIAHQFLPLLQKKESLGIFVGVTSVGQHLFMNGASGYQTAKLALHNFIEFIGYESATKEKNGDGKNVVAFVTNPGAVKTELAMNLPQEVHGSLNDTPELCGDTMVWLTKERRDWLKGRYLSVTWDMKELEAVKDEIVAKDLLKMRVTL